MTVGKAYRVFWLDASFAWEPPVGGIGAMCQCMGWLVKTDDTGYRLAFEVGRNGIEDGTRFHMDIPAGMIVEYEEIEL